MQITLNEADLNTAIRLLLHAKGINVAEHNVTVDIKPGRKYGTSVDVTLEPREQTVTESTSSLDEARPSPINFGS